MRNPFLMWLVAAACLTAAAQAQYGSIGFDPRQSGDPRDAFQAASNGQSPEFLRTGYVSPKPALVPIEWIKIEAGKYNMGTDNGYDNALPVHPVKIEKAFYMAKTDVTVEQYANCVNAINPETKKPWCKAPGKGRFCNWERAGRERHPVNCIDWNDANDYANFACPDGKCRLPTEAEWEYAATNQGENVKYPWGNEEPTCDKAVMYGNGGDGHGCGTEGTMPVCSKPAGNTKQGLCDMSGNVWQWVKDVYQHGYWNASPDGKAFEGAGSHRVVRGGSFLYYSAGDLRSDYRNFHFPGYRHINLGFRLVRD